MSTGPYPNRTTSNTTSGESDDNGEQDHKWPTRTPTTPEQSSSPATTSSPGLDETQEDYQVTATYDED